MIERYVLRVDSEHLWLEHKKSAKAFHESLQILSLMVFKSSFHLYLKSLIVRPFKTPFNIRKCALWKVSELIPVDNFI